MTQKVWHAVDQCFLHVKSASMYISTDVMIHAYLSPLIFILTFGTAFGALLLGSASGMSWSSHSLLLMMMVYILLWILLHVQHGLDWVLETPVIPIPDYLVLKIYKRRIDLHFLIWKETMHYTGNEIVGIKIVNSDFVPFSTRPTLRRFLYIFLKQKAGDRVNLHNFRIAFQAALTRLVTRIGLMGLGDKGSVGRIEDEIVLEKQLEIWRLGIHAKNNDLEHPFRFKRHVDVISKAFYAAQVDEEQRNQSENAVHIYCSNLIVRIAYIAVEEHRIMHDIRGVYSISSPRKDPMHPEDNTTDAAQTEANVASVERTTRLCLWNELKDLLNLPLNLFEEQKAEFQRKLPGLVIEVSHAYMHQLTRTAENKDDAFDDCLRLYVETILHRKNSLIEVMMLAVFCPDSSLSLGKLAHACVKQCVSVTAYKYFSRERNDLVVQFYLHLINRRSGYIDIDELSNFFDTVGIRQRRQSKILPVAHAVDSGAKNVVLCYFLEYVRTTKHALPSPRDVIPFLRGHFVLNKADEESLFYVRDILIYSQFGALVVIPLHHYYPIEVTYATSALYLFLEMGSVEYGALKFWLVVVCMMCFLFQFARCVDCIIYDTHPEWLNTLGFALRAFVRRSEHALLILRNSEKRLRRKVDKATLKALAKESELQQRIRLFIQRARNKRHELHQYVLAALGNFANKLCYGIEQACVKERAVDAVLADEKSSRTITLTFIFADVFLIPTLAILESALRCNTCGLWMGTTAVCGSPLQLAVSFLARLLVCSLILILALCIPGWNTLLRLHNFTYGKIAVARESHREGFGCAMYELDNAHFSFCTHGIEILTRCLLCIVSINQGPGISNAEIAQTNMIVLSVFFFYMICSELSVTMFTEKQAMHTMKRFSLHAAIVVGAAAAFFIAEKGELNTQTFANNATALTNHTWANTSRISPRRQLLEQNLSLAKFASPLCLQNTSQDSYSKLSCDFENGEMCGWIKSGAGQTNWTVHEGGTETYGTGPLYADDDSLKYLLLDSSLSYLNWGDQAIIYTPWFTLPARDTKSCFFDISFHMRGGKDPITGMGSLYVQQRNLICSHGNILVNDTWLTLLSSHGNKGFDWNRTSLHLVNDVAIPTQIKITGVVHGTTSDMAVDTLVLRCEEIPLVPVPMPPFIPPSNCWNTFENLECVQFSVVVVCILLGGRMLWRQLKRGAQKPQGLWDDSARLSNRSCCSCIRRTRTFTGDILLVGLDHRASLAFPRLPRNDDGQKYAHLSLGRDEYPCAVQVVSVQAGLCARTNKVARVSLWQPIETKRVDPNLIKYNKAVYKRTNVHFTHDKHSTQNPVWTHGDGLPKFAFSSIEDAMNCHFILSFYGPSGICKPNCGRVKATSAYRFCLAQESSTLKRCYENEDSLDTLPVINFDSAKVRTMQTSLAEGKTVKCTFEVDKVCIIIALVCPSAHKLVISRSLDIPMNSIHEWSVDGDVAQHARMLHFVIKMDNRTMQRELEERFEFAKAFSLFQHTTKCYLGQDVLEANYHSEQMPFSFRRSFESGVALARRSIAGTKTWFLKWNIVHFSIGVAVAGHLLALDFGKAIYSCVCEKKARKIVSDYVEEGESPKKGVVGMKVAVKHAFNKHKHVRDFYQWRDATIIRKGLSGNTVKIVYDTSEDTRWVTLSPENVLWRKNVRQRRGCVETNKYVVHSDEASFF